MATNESLSREERVREGRRLLELLGRSSLIGTSIPHPSKPGETLRVEEFPLIYDGGRYEAHVRPFLAALESMPLDDPEREDFIKELNLMLNNRLGVSEQD